MAAAAGDRLRRGIRPRTSLSPLFLGGLGALVVGACHPVSRHDARLSATFPVPSVSVEDAALERLRGWESEVRAKVDFAHAKTSDQGMGTDPYVVRPLGGSGVARFVGLLRGRSVLVVLDATMREIDRLPAPSSASGLAVVPGGGIFAVGELSSHVARYRRTARGVEAAGTIELPGVRAMRDVATGPEGVIYVVEEHDGRLLTLATPTAPERSEAPKRIDTTVCHGPLRLLRVGRSLLIDCLVDHAILVRPVGGDGFPGATELRITHDGPMWGMDALDEKGILTVAVGGVEDHPLDRTEGSFGFIDSFVTLYRVAGGVAVKTSEVNMSELGVVTPKALKLSRAKGGLRLTVAGYGSDRLATLEWAVPGASAPSSIETRAVPPGTAMITAFEDGFAIANPLIDAWVRVGPVAVDVVPVEDDASRTRSTDSRLGEALFFTTLMAPWDRSEGRLSRFTCEACHFEGYVDGRTHRTGRGDVRATTKPLLGLLNNRPHFSRALDPDLATMVDNEFRVAGAKSDHDPWFSLTARDFPWLRDVAVDVHETLAPERLRRALMTFFMGFTHRPNPSVVGRAAWTDAERAGADVFRRRCESCHQARLVADEPSTRVAFAGWEPLVMSPQAPIVWATSDYEMTGVLPYVSSKGARVVSLRRLYKKYPYFTNGSAKDLRSVLDGVGFADGGPFFHQGAPERARRLPDDEKEQLAAFLDLL